MTNLANSYWELDRREEALELQEEAIPLLERILGPRHPQTLVEQGNLAIYYGFFDRLEEARRIEETTLKLLKEVLGPEHLDTLVVMHNLAATYKRLERWHDALKLQEPVLELRREILGPEHSLTLSSMRNLAIFYDGVGRSEEAIELMEETLALHKKVLGPEHPAIPPVACNLTDIYRAAGRVEDALELGKETLELSRRVLGATHIHTLTAMTSLVACHDAAGQAEQALKLQEDLVELCRESRGTSDKFTLEAMGRLGIFYQKAGRNDDSLKLREETFQLLRESLGPEHRETLGAMTNLAGSYWLTGRHSEAVELHEAALEINRRVLKPDDSFTAVALQGLAHCYRETGRPEKAAELWAELLEIRRKYLGPEHHDTLQAIVELGNHCELAGLLDEALKLKVEALELSRTVLGPEHPGTATAARVLGFAYDAAGGQTENAIQAWQEAVRINPKWYVVHYWLGKALADRKQPAEALAPLQAAHEMIPPSSPEYRENLGRLRAALLALGREEEAKALLTDQPLPSPASKRPFPAAVAVLVAPDSEWRWLHPVDGVDPAESDPDFHSTFFAKAYDDAAWASGRDRDGPSGGFGYDEGFAGVDIGIPQEEQPDQEGKAVRRGAYFRHHFSSTREHRNLELRCQRDDGVIVYLDGVEVARENMEKGEEAYDLPATRAIGGEEETTPVRIPLTMEFLPAGDHILAISLHNTARPSSDLRIGAITLVEAELTETLILSGHWIDLNGGSIRIDQNGAELTASGENEVVTKHWTSAAGRLEGHTVHMTHYIRERKTNTESGRVSSDGSRIDWMNGTSWKRSRPGGDFGRQGGS